MPPVSRFQNITPHRCELENGLVMKTAGSASDIDRVAECHSVVFGEEGTGELCRHLFLHHPNTRPDDLIFVEDEKKGEVVSSICLIPWKWHYENVILDAGELALVSSREVYRHRGLIRKQVDYLKQLLDQRSFHLSHIQGIPYFYRQFGYEYAIPLEGGCRLELNQVPTEEKEKTTPFSCRLMTKADAPVVRRLYDEADGRFQIHAIRDKRIWEYLLKYTEDTETEREGWIVENAKGEIVGSFFIRKREFGEGLEVAEASVLSYDAAISVLRHLKKLAEERRKPYIRLVLPPHLEISQVARCHGAKDSGDYAWQIYIPDMARFLNAIGPVLERRLEDSAFKGLTEEVQLDLFKNTVSLDFQDGKLVGTRMQPGGKGAIHIPPRAAVQLVLGHKDRRELQRSWPDMHMSPKGSYLIDVLFPKMTSCMSIIY